jgi:hypothetical protein
MKDHEVNILTLVGGNLQGFGSRLAGVGKRPLFSLTIATEPYLQGYFYAFFFSYAWHMSFCLYPDAGVLSVVRVIER